MHLRQNATNFIKERLQFKFMMQVLFMLVCVSLYANADGDSAPFITPCLASDSACMRSTAQKALPILAAGVPAMGISVMDPMQVDRVTASQAGLEMDFKNTIVKGLRNCLVESLKRKGKQTFLDLKCSVILVGDYTLGGKLLILPIEGNGRYKIKIRDILVKIMFEVEEKTVGGEKYWNVYGWKHTTDVQTNVQYRFENLFNGNKQLSDTIHEFANSNWREIFQEVAPPIVKAIVAKIVVEVQKLFDNVPERELALH